MKHTVKYLIIMSAVTVLAATACEPTDEKLTNAVAFSAGEVVDYATTSQFLLVTSDEGWSIKTTYTAPEGVADWCTLNHTEGTGKANLIMTFSRNTLEVERKAVFTVTFTSGEILSLDFTQRGQTPDVADAHPAWLELPSSRMDDTHLYTTHYLPKADGGGRSFTIFYDTEHHLPVWVAYTLHTSNVGSGSRTNVWGFDPQVPVSKQVDLSRSYSGSYDRGHMLPSASRLTSSEANTQTFYYTNMTPQLSSLNQYGWASIEGSVRGWKGTESDTLYVVTGAVLRTVGGNEPIENISAANGTFSSKPNYYYKALLKLSHYDGNKSYQAMAIWVEHKARTDAVKAADIITIDELEARTGIDFFSNLDLTTQTQVESTYNLSFWKISQ